MTKQYKSDLGKKYQEVQENLWLDNLSSEIYGMFNAYICFGEKLPISVECNKELKQDDVNFIINDLAKRGCKVEYQVLELTQHKDFVLIDLE